MKKNVIYILAAAAAVAAISCNKEIAQEEPVNNEKVTVLTARPEPETRTSLDGVNVVWSASDAITAFDSEGNAYGSTNTEIEESGSIAKFTVGTEDPKYAVYPAYSSGSETAMSSGQIAATIPTSQQVVAGSFADGANVAVAYISDKDDMHFKNVGGLLAVKINGTTHTIVSITIAANESMTGDIFTSIDASNSVTTAFSAAESAETAKSVTLTTEAEDGFSATNTYYAVVAPGTYSDVTITFEDTDGKTATYTKKTGLTVERNSNTLIGGFDIPDSKWATGGDNIINGHEFVDLGLSVKWATMNVGASKPEDCGDYFAWGEIATKEDYSWSTYKWGNSTTTLTRYVISESYGTVDNKTSFADYDYDDDAARKNWEGTWRTPTDAEWTALVNTKFDTENYTWTWCDGSTTKYNDSTVKGWKIERNSTCATLFLPAAGRRNGTSLDYAGSNGFYWSSSLRTNNSGYARSAGFYSSDVYRDSYYRYFGQSVRPVSE